MNVLSGFINVFPAFVKQELRRLRYAWLIKRGNFRSSEKEFAIVPEIIKKGDWVIDIGANVGHYTLLFSSLVKEQGRVLAFEPIPQTFDLLSSNVNWNASNNVTLINAAVHNQSGVVSFTIPEGNFYQSYITEYDGEHSVLGYPLENFLVNERPVQFLKIDAEGCDDQIVRDCAEYLSRARPIVMVELDRDRLKALCECLSSYCAMALDGSHNGFLVPVEQAARMEEIGLILCSPSGNSLSVQSANPA